MRGCLEGESDIALVWAMILSNREIQKAVDQGLPIIRPEPTPRILGGLATGPGSFRADRGVVHLRPADARAR